MTDVRIAIYDLDRTITRRATWTPFLLAAIRARAPWRILLAPVAFGAAGLKAVGLIDRAALKQMMHRLALGRLTSAQADRLATRFLATFGAREIRGGARARIAADRRAGYQIVIATAAYAFYAEAFAREVAADGLVATRAMRDGDVILPRIDGDNAYGAAKLAMIRDWMAAQGLARDRAHVRFYSDHISDLPTFDWADESFAVNPSPALRRHAALRGWTTLEWS